jgi:glycogen(starch) synthase
MTDGVRRILIWSELFWPYLGGSQVFAVNLIQGLRKRGYEFIVVTRQDDLDFPSEATFQGIPVYRFPFYDAMAEGNIERLVKIRRQVGDLKQKFAPDLVHINGFGMSILFHMDTARRYPAPLLVTLHGDRYPPPAGRDTLLAQTLRVADWVACPSAATLGYAHKLLEDFTCSSVIYNGVEESSVLPEALPFDPPRILCVGRLSSEKGLDLALSAFAAVADRFPRARLVLAGDGPERPALEQQTARLGLTDVVDFAGWVAPEKVPQLINAATIVMMPSWREGLPLVAIEAALMARPIVATRVGGLPEIVVHQETGWIVDKGDISGLAEAVSLFLARPELATEMGNAAQRRARDVFRLETCVNAYEDLYRKLIKEIPDVTSASGGADEQNSSF